jgi:hypothetical protein
LKDDAPALEHRQATLNELLDLLPSTRAQRFSYAEKLSKDRAEMRDVLVLWLSFWRDVLWRTGGSSAEIANIDREGEINSLAQRLSLSQARRLVADLDRALRRLEASINPRLLGEVLLLDWPHGSTARR